MSEKRGTRSRKKEETDGRALVPSSKSRTTVARTGQPSQSIIVPQGYTAREVKPAKNYDVVSFGRAMNDNFGERVKKLFDPETEAALQAQKTGIYIGWRCPEFKHDCQRVGPTGKCFCGHLLNEHGKYTARSMRVPCKAGGCRCSAFAWVPSRPEEVGEFWFQRRRDFDPAAWRVKCKCKHTHEQHDPNGSRRCKACGCGLFTSASVCAACDHHWERHETFFESAAERQEAGLPVGENYIPFAEIPSLRNMALTGEDDEDMSYMALNPGPYAAGPDSIPGARALPSSSQTSNDMPFPHKKSSSGFRPVYD